MDNHFDENIDSSANLENNNKNEYNSNSNITNSDIEIVTATDINEEQKLETNYTELWNQVGFHRIIGGVFYPYFLILIGSILGLFVVAFVTQFKPYPEIDGYAALTGSLLGFWFGLMDFNLGGGGSFSDGVSRFIGQYSDNDPIRALQYISFYIWFQMITGLIQVTAISIAVFYFIPQTSLAFLCYMIFYKSLSQYPGFLMIMEASLKSFQRGDKTAWLSWLQDTVFQVSVNIIFLLIGNWWGTTNPAIGRLMGITIFWILAQFMDDWLNLFVGAKMFSTVLKERGIDHGILRLFIPDFDKDIIFECLSFTGKQWIGNQIKGLIGYFIGLYLIVRMPQMGSWTGLMLIPGFLGHLVSMAPIGSPAVPAVSEAYNNGKKDLAQYFIHDILKWYSFVTFFMVPPLLVFTPKILGIVLDSGLVGALENYQAGLIMIPWIMIRDAMGELRGLWGKIFVACDRPMPPIYLDYVFTPSGYAFQFLFLYLCVDAQVLPVWMLLIMPNFINDTIKMVFGYIWIQKSVIEIQYKKIFMQAFGAHVLAAVGYTFCMYLFQFTGWPLLDILFVGLFGNLGTVVTALVVLLSALFIFPALFYAPFYAYFGGWDEFTIEEFRKAALISGPSKFMVMLLYKISNFFKTKSPLDNKFPIANYEVVKQQVQELIDEGKANLLLKK